MKTWFTKEFMKASAVLLIVFAAGAGTGYVGGHKYAEYKFINEYKSRSDAPKPLARMTRSRRARSGNRFMRRLERDLNLNPAQRVNVDRALQRHYELIRDIRSRHEPPDQLHHAGNTQGRAFFPG